MVLNDGIKDSLELNFYASTLVAIYLWMPCSKHTVLLFMVYCIKVFVIIGVLPRPHYEYMARVIIGKCKSKAHAVLAYGHLLFSEVCECVLSLRLGITTPDKRKQNTQRYDCPSHGYMIPHFQRLSRRLA